MVDGLSVLEEMVSSRSLLDDTDQLLPTYIRQSLSPVFQSCVGRGGCRFFMLSSLSFLLTVLRIFVGLYWMLYASKSNAAHLHTYFMPFYTNAACMHHGGADWDFSILYFHA